MSGIIVALNDERLKKCLDQIYQIQMSNCFPEEIMPRAMEKLGINEASAIELLKSFISLGWISVGNIRPGFFLRPGYVSNFPVIVSSAGMEMIRG
ncbi:MAG: hypothetical protein ACYDEQ_02070 [Desulfocucumaceae bacterium]